MKKIIFIITLLTIIFISNDLTKEKVIIPKESIRFRVISNSDLDSDIQIKEKVAYNLEKEVTKLLNNSNSIEESRYLLKNNIDLFKDNIENTLKNNNSNQAYNINYGQNYFPNKEYKNVLYKEGNYESLVVTLGKGEGKNFWCVLFPPLCLIDEDKNNDLEYHMLVKDIVNKFLSHK